MLQVLKVLSEEVNLLRSFELLETGFLCCFQLCFHFLLCFLLLLQGFLLIHVFHATLGKGLVSHETAIHTFHRHLASTTGLLNAIAMILIRLIVTSMVLGFRHGQVTSCTSDYTTMWLP